MEKAGGVKRQRHGGISPHRPVPDGGFNPPARSRKKGPPRPAATTELNHRFAPIDTDAAILTDCAAKPLPGVFAVLFPRIAHFWQSLPSRLSE